MSNDKPGVAAAAPSRPQTTAPPVLASGPACATITLRGSPAHIGRAQAGFILANETYANVSSLRVWRSTLATPADSLAAALQHWNPALLDEICSAADALSVPPGAILSTYLPRQAHNGPDNGPDEAGCTMVGATNSDAECALVGRNFDLGYSRADIRLLPTYREGALASIGCGGWFGRFDGINESGLVATMAIVETRQTPPPEPGAVPPTLLVRTMLDHAATAQEALALVEEVPAWSPTNYLIAGPSGPPVVVERAPGFTRLRPASEGMVAATNHFLGASDARRASLLRYQTAAAKDACALRTFDGMRDLLAEVSDPKLTRWTEVFVPKDLTVYFSGGCGASFINLRVSQSA